MQILQQRYEVAKNTNHDFCISECIHRGEAPGFRDLDYDHSHSLENSRNKFNFGKLAYRKFNCNI